MKIYSFFNPKRAAFWIHLALMTIVIGACVTHFAGVQGELHLRADKAQTVTVREQSVSLFLWDFRIIADAEGNPADYLSELRLLDRSQAEMAIDTGFVRMNKPLKYHGFRFCQSDYDSDLQGVVFAYNYDPWGIGITYAGYAMLLVAMIAFFFDSRTRFRALLKSLATQWPYSKALLQWSGLAAIAVIIILALVMTKVVTPKPPLQPVLQTPLLGIHVSVIMLAYTLFAIIAINGVLGLCVAQWRERLMAVSQVLLYPALFCLTTGIFIGAVWANMSWGRYWGWDPKETWALITMIVYAGLLHLPMMVSHKTAVSSPKYLTAYHLACIVAFFFVLFTYFGVSYLLGGLHSYA